MEAAGINNVEWDAVELPSQFMENWCYHVATVLGTPAQPGLARHWQTGAALPRELFDKLVAARTYRAGSMMGNYSETSGAFCASAPRGAQFFACFRDEVGERWY
jgi:Zn-dependent oligopeptidase